MKDSLSFPDYVDKTVRVNDIGKFFVEKISGTRGALDDVVATMELGENETTSDVSLFESLKLYSEDDVRELIINSKMTSCGLDPMPSTLLLLCIN